LIESIAAVLRGYGLGEHETVHAIRTLRCTLHGYAMLQISSAFQWSGDAEDSFDWLIDFADRGLRTESMTTTATGASTKRTRRS